MAEVVELKGNAKRIASCTKVGGAKKRGGHATEDLFTQSFGIPTPTTYKAEADCTIDPSNPNGASLIEELTKVIGVIPDYKTSVKSGNMQFTLGRIDEIVNAEDKIQAISQVSLWNKYLKKSESSNPASVLAYKDDSAWTFFKMDDVVSFIVNKAKWRLLDSGRIKGDFDDTSKKGQRQYLTYEYRSKHKSYFLGANGAGGGPKFIALLKANLPHLRKML